MSQPGHIIIIFKAKTKYTENTYSLLSRVSSRVSEYITKMKLKKNANSINVFKYINYNAIFHLIQTPLSPLTSVIV